MNIINRSYGRLGYMLLVMLALNGLWFKSYAQLDPFQSAFYQNRYLLNPAFAGMKKGVSVNSNLKRQWNSFPGSPKTALFSGDVAASDKVGFGAYVNDDQSGLIRITKVLGTFAYHIQLDDGDSKRINFGLSLGVNDSRIDLNRVVGDGSDTQILDYNRQKPFLDGDFGVAYTSDSWLVSATMPNLNSTILKISDNRFNADQLLFTGVVGYKFKINSNSNNMTLEPLAAYRMIKNYDDVLDAGLNLDFPDYGLNLQTMYHSNKNMSIGAGIGIKKVNLFLNYNFETGQVSTYTNGTFELALRLHLFSK